MSRTTPNYAPVVGSTDPAMMGGAAPPNGRVDIMSPLPVLNIPAYQQRSVRNDTYVGEATFGQKVPNELSCIFFSEQNINALQDGLRYRIWVETNGKYVIGRQSDQELKIIMRSIYYQHARNHPTNVVGQVQELNGKVLEWTVPEVLSNLKQYEVFRKDASSLPTPMDRSPIMTSKGTRTLEIKSFF